MLPEHVELLKEVFAEEYRIEKPTLDEQQMLENELILQEAIHNDLMVEIKYYDDGKFEKVKGKVSFIDALDGVLHLEDMQLSSEKITEAQII